MQAVYDRLALYVAKKLARALGFDPDDKAASPIIDLIVSLLPMILPLLIGCFATPAQATAQANRPDFLRRISLRRFLLENVPGFDAETVRLRHAAFDVLLDAGTTITEAEMATLAA